MEITDQEAVLNLQKDFYSELYKARSVNFNSIHENVFLPQNSTRKKLSLNESLTCEGEVTAEECLNALKQMKNNKSPGNDGFTVEFFKFFWNDIKSLMVRSINYSYKVGHMSISQRRGLITSIPKGKKDKRFLKNWRPISLLCVDYKTASAVIANRVKKRSFQTSYPIHKRDF